MSIQQRRIWLQIRVLTHHASIIIQRRQSVKMVHPLPYRRRIGIGTAGTLLILANAIIICFAVAVTHSKPLTCEEKLTLNETSLHVDIRNLMNNYTGWGELLDSAPLAISGLGRLIVLSHQKMDFPYVDYLPTFPKKFNYPQSYRNSLLEISRQGNLAFLKAHENIEKIRMVNSEVSIPIRNVTRNLMSRNWEYINDVLYRAMKNSEKSTFYSKPLSAEVVKGFQVVLELVEEMIMTTKQMELRRRNTQQVLEEITQRNKSFPFTKFYYVEAINALQKVSIEFDKLKSALTRLIEFYSKMSNFISKAITQQNLVFIRNARYFSGGLSTFNNLDNEEKLRNFWDNVQKATGASFLVHRVSDMYLDVSGMYIVDQMAHLDEMMKFNASEVDLDRMQLMELTWSTESDAEGIRHFIKADETLLREKLVERHNYIVNEYKRTEDCDSPEDRQLQTQ